MLFTNLILAAILVLAGGAILFGLVMGVGAYLRYRGKRLVTCPETQKAAAVHVDLTAAARHAILGKAPKIHLDQCSRWPERRNCGQDCLSQIDADPDGCLVWNIVEDWYKGKSCAYCQKPFTELHWHDRRPALLAPDRNCVQWNDVRAETLPEIFRTHLPVCWNCYIAETFRRQHPDRVIDRRWDRGAGGEYVPQDSESPAPGKSTGTDG